MTETPMHPFLLTTVICISIPIIWQFWKWLFGNTEGFLDDVRTAAEPDWYALWRGRYLEGEWAELKISVFIALCVGLVSALYKLGIVLLY